LNILKVLYDEDDKILYSEISEGSISDGDLPVLEDLEIWAKLTSIRELRSEDTGLIEKLYKKCLATESHPTIEWFFGSGLLKSKLFSLKWEGEEGDILTIQHEQRYGYEWSKRYVHTFLRPVVHGTIQIKLPCGPCGGTSKNYYKYVNIYWYTLDEDPQHRLSADSIRLSIMGISQNGKKL